MNRFIKAESPSKMKGLSAFNVEVLLIPDETLHSDGISFNEVYEVNSSC